MCGRFTQTRTAKEVAEAFDVEAGDFPLFPRYNVAPTQEVLAVRWDGARDARSLALLKWGLVPSWSKDTKGAAKHINARSETAADKPAFRSAFKRRRCLIPADGFFEWQKVGKAKQPYRFTLTDGGLFGLAGLWEEWHHDEDGEVLQTCTVLTTDANGLVRPMHDRMPVILDPDEYDRWLDPSVSAKEELLGLLNPYPAGEMRAVAVNPRVNSARNDDPACIEPVAD